MIRFKKKVPAIKNILPSCLRKTGINFFVSIRINLSHYYYNYPWNS